METISFVMSSMALVLYCASYFFNNKKKYLILQLVGNVFLSLSYLFMGAYFTMVAVVVGIARGLICYTYEKKDKKVPLYIVTANKKCFKDASVYIEKLAGVSGISFIDDKTALRSLEYCLNESPLSLSAFYIICEKVKTRALIY